MNQRARVVLPLIFTLLAATALTMPLEEKVVVVGQGGIKLYPRWNKAFKPIAALEEKDKLIVLKSSGAWKQVEVPSKKLKGWVYIEVEDDDGKNKPLTLPLGPTPTTSGLVTKGWSAGRYAREKSIDVGPVQELMGRRLDGSRFNDFLEEGGLTR